VTNAQFARFVAATKYRTVGERLDPKEHPGVPPELLAPGAVVFTPPDGLRKLVDVTQWWRYTPGADWRHTSGPDSSIEGRANHPVVNIAYEDAQAYAQWLGRELPTEAQWEFAARGGLDGTTYSWGDEYYDPRAGCGLTPGKGYSRSRTMPTTATTAQHRSAASSRTAMACSTWPATFGYMWTSRSIRPDRRSTRRGRAQRWPPVTPGRLPRLW
jgi:formylglycine-generating enzyme required for sulfatase activity